MEKVEIAYSSAVLSRIDKQLDDVENRLVKVIDILFEKDIIKKTEEDDV